MQSDLNKIADAGYVFAPAGAPFTPGAPTAPVQEVPFENVNPSQNENPEA